MLLALVITVVLNCSPVQVDGERIRKAVEEYIYSASGASRQELLVELRGRLPRLTATTKEYAVKVSLDNVPRFKGYVSIPVEIVSQGKTEARATVAVRIRTFGTVVVTHRLLQQHEALSTENTSLATMETTSVPDDRIVDLRGIEGKQSARMIAADAIVTTSMIENIPLIRQGDHLVIMVGMLNAVVKVEGTAKQDGCMGDVIEVQRSGSHERLQGRIVSAHAVELVTGERPLLLQKN
jgi:flagella basal body P-ring formation protein FlgA